MDERCDWLAQLTAKAFALRRQIVNVKGRAALLMRPEKAYEHLTMVNRLYELRAELSNYEHEADDEASRLRSRGIPMDGVSQEAMTRSFKMEAWDKM